VTPATPAEILEGAITMAEPGIRITINRSADYIPSKRLAAAIAELDAALDEDHGHETIGFGYTNKPFKDDETPWDTSIGQVSFTYQKIEWNVIGGSLSTIVSTSDVDSI
jgi:hypothetical protein